jgi:hypothetical protein
MVNGSATSAVEPSSFAGRTFSSQPVPGATAPAPIRPCRLRATRVFRAAAGTRVSGWLLVGVAWATAGVRAQRNAVQRSCAALRLAEARVRIRTTMCRSSSNSNCLTPQCDAKGWESTKSRNFMPSGQLRLACVLGLKHGGALSGVRRGKGCRRCRYRAISGRAPARRPPTRDLLHLTRCSSPLRGRLRAGGPCHSACAFQSAAEGRP